MHVIVTMRLSDVKAVDKLRPLLESDQVDKVTLVRYKAVNLNSDKLAQVTYSSSADFQSKWQTLYFTLLNMWIVLRLAKREKPTAILGYYLTPYGVIAWIAARLTGSRSMISLIGSDFNKRLKMAVLGKLLLRLLRNTDAIMVFGDVAKKGLIDQGVDPSRVFVLPNTADTTIYFYDSTAQPDRDLIFVGNLLPGKRIDLILRALEKVQENRPETSLLIVGDGIERTRLQNLAQSLGVADSVEFYGQSDRVVVQLRRAQIFIMLSDHEGLPMALVEAMCTGLPAIATTVGAIPTVIADGQNGFLVSAPAEPTKVAEFILQLLNNPVKYAVFSEAAAQLRNTHSYSRSTQVWTEIMGRFMEPTR